MEKIFFGGINVESNLQGVERNVLVVGVLIVNIPKIYNQIQIYTKCYNIVNFLFLYLQISFNFYFILNMNNANAN